MNWLGDYNTFTSQQTKYRAISTVSYLLFELIIRHINILAIDHK
jgi:hypothetical protein